MEESLLFKPVTLAKHKVITVSSIYVEIDLPEVWRIQPGQPPHFLQQNKTELKQSIGSRSTIEGNYLIFSNLLLLCLCDM